MSVPVDVLVVTATAAEGAALGARLEGTTYRAVANGTLLHGGWGRLRVDLLTAGLGKVNTALALGAHLGGAGADRPDLLLSLGVGGAYPSSGLAPGDLAVATEEVYGDEGVETGEGFGDLREIGIPLLETGGTRLFNRLPADGAATAALGRASERLGFRWATGPFVTVSTVTGSAATARRLEQRWGGLCESMEGAAAAHAAAAFGVPFAEVRGISNHVGPRDRASWKLREAAEAAQEAALSFLGRWVENSVREG